MSSKKQKLQQAKLEESKNKMIEFSKSLEALMEETTVLGRDVLAFGDPGQCKTIVGQFLFFENCKYKVDKVLLDIKISEGMKKMSEVSLAFFKNISTLAKDMQSITKDKQLRGVIKEFAQNAQNSEFQLQKAQSGIEKAQATFNEMVDMSASDDKSAAVTSADEKRVVELFTKKGSAQNANQKSDKSKSASEEIDDLIAAMQGKLLS